jgi:hypothetical protein
MKEFIESYCDGVRQRLEKDPENQDVAASDELFLHALNYSLPYQYCWELSMANLETSLAFENQTTEGNLRIVLPALMPLYACHLKEERNILCTNDIITDFMEKLQDRLHHEALAQPSSSV